MKILAVDTSTTCCSVSITNKEKIVAEISLVSGKTHSRHLMDIIEKILQQSDLEIEEIDGFAVSIGPGSFTGLRIGSSAVKGLAFAHGKPVVCISSLEALATQIFFFNEKLICPMIDARKNEIYSSFFKYNKNQLLRESDETVLPLDIVLKKINEPCFFTGSGATLYKNEIIDLKGSDAHFLPDSYNSVNASVIATLAYKKILANQSGDLKSFKPVYIRKSDAELNYRSK